MYTQDVKIENTFIKIQEQVLDALQNQPKVQELLPKSNNINLA